MRLSLASDLKSRDGSLDKDALSKNAVVEIDGDSVSLIKRPGVVSLGEAGTGPSQLLACYNGQLKSVIGDSLSDLIVSSSPLQNTGARLMDLTGSWADPAFGNGVFVTINMATNTPATSADAVTWTLHAPIDVSLFMPDAYFDKVTFGGGTFYAMCGDAKALYTSTDGINWSHIDGFDFGVRTFDSTVGLVYANGQLMTSPYASSSVVVFDGSFNPVEYEYDSGWMNFESPQGISINYFSGKYFVLVTSFYYPGECRVMSSDDLVTWDMVSLPYPFQNLNTSILLTNSTRLVIAGRGWTDDGINWTESTGVPSYYNIVGACFDNSIGYLIAHDEVGTRHYVYSSADDGETWAKIHDYPAIAEYQFWGGAIGAGKYVAMGFGMYSVLNELSSSSNVILGSDTVTVDGTSPITVIDPDLSFFAEVSGQAQSQNVLMLKNAKEAWTYDGTTITKISDADYPGWNEVTPVSITRSGSTVTITLSAPVNWKAKSTVTVAGADQTEYNGDHEISIVDATHVSYQIATTPATPATGTITVTGGITTVPGVVYLDGYFFVMDEDATIYGCENGDVTNWNALNFIKANTEPGSGIALAKSGNFVVALKAWSTEFFYDAGNATGSPLSPVMNAFQLIGCASGLSVANIDGTVIWVSKTRQKGRSVHMMVGQEQRKISTSDVERILNADPLVNVYSYGVKVSGHTFYVLGLKDSNITLVADLASSKWSIWTSLTPKTPVACSISVTDGVASVFMVEHGLEDGDPVIVSGAAEPDFNGAHQISKITSNLFTFPVSAVAPSVATGSPVVTSFTETYFKFTKYAYCSGKDLVLHESNGQLYEITESNFTDAGNPINFLTRTGKHDRSNVLVKTSARVEVIGNKEGGQAMIRWSDDDFESASLFKSIDLSSKHPAVRRTGSYVRRGYELRHVGDAPVRVSSLDIS